MAQPRTHDSIRRELKRLSASRRKARTIGTDHCQKVLGAEWALQWVLGLPNARAVSSVVKTIASREKGEER
jgi:hypothetical protein